MLVSLLTFLGALAVLGVVLWVVRRWRKRQLGRGMKIDGYAAEQVGAELLDFVKLKSHEQGARSTSDPSGGVAGCRRLTGTR